jgi:uncharacterized membrane protein YdjX (TVP38/TMEM64 family)
MAHRLALIQDAGPTFAAIATALEAARRSVFVVGWDLDSRTVLRPEASCPEDARSVRRFLQRQGFWSVIFIRLAPLGNFGMLKLVAGALHVPHTSFTLGNMVGLLPGLLGLGMIVDRLRALLRDPNPINVVLAGVVLLAVLGLAVLVKRRFRPAPERNP